MPASGAMVDMDYTQPVDTDSLIVEVASGEEDSRGAAVP